MQLSRAKVRESFINRHKTKFTGLVISILGALQVSPELRAVMSPAAFGLTTIAIGIVVQLFGVINTILEEEDAIEEESEEGEPPTVLSWLSFFALLTVFSFVTPWAHAEIDKQTTGPWFLVASSTPQYPSYTTYDLCRQARTNRIEADRLGKQSGSTTYYCREGVTVTFKANPPPPVNCVVSAWGDWSVCSNGSQTRSRTITTAPANGGTVCPVLTESRACTVTPPPTTDVGVNMPIVCTTPVEAGAVIEACPWSNQIFQPASADSYVRGCLTAGCGWTDLRWRRFGDLPSIGGVDVCRIEKRSGDPVAGGSCEADGEGWGGMGQVQPAVVARAATGGGGPVPTGQARLSWAPPTHLIDDTPIMNLAGYVIAYGRAPNELTQMIEINNPATTAYVVTNLSAGTWYFAVSAFLESGAESAFSTPPGTKTIQ